MWRGGADGHHAERFHAADFRFLDLETLLLADGIERGANGGYHHGLSGGHIRGAADNLHGGLETQVYGGDVQVVAVGMVDACEHLPDDHAAEASAD